MLSQVHIQIVSKITESILQTRLDVKKSLFNHLQGIFKSFKTQGINRPVSLYQLLAVLLLQDSYRIKQRLLAKNQGVRLSTRVTIQVLFTLTERTTGNKIDAECWTVNVTRKKIQKGHESVLMVAQFFQEIILILNKLPLFSVYQKERQMKTRYFLDHKILYESSKQFSMFELRGLHVVQRQSQSLSLSAKVAYCPSLNFLNPKTEFSAKQKRKQSTVTSDYDGDRRMSVYAFYDPQLDFTFLSSDEESFKMQGESQQIKVEVDHSQISEQFELLISNQDQEFCNDSQEYFDVITQIQKEYMFE